MKTFAIKLMNAVALAGWTALLLTGCGGTHYAEQDTVNPSQPFMFPGQPTVAQSQLPLTSPPVAVNPDQMTSGVLRVGDVVHVNLLDIPQPPPQIAIRIPEDGRITLPWNITVDARGKTISQLQEEIRNAYVPRFFVRLTVNIKSEERWYYVGGEVRAPARQVYSGEMTVLRAIDTVGGFTDFANRKNIELRRSNGQTFKINWNKAIKDQKLDLPVYPNDQITVHKRVLF
jgi:polysaccharide biosynthesis/export protein VpsN